MLLDSTPATVLIEDEEMDTTIGGNVTMRGSFLIDEEGVVRHAVLNDLPLGRNIDEMLRMVDALTFHANNGDVCPANWREGKAAMKASTYHINKKAETMKANYYITLKENPVSIRSIISSFGVSLKEMKCLLLSIRTPSLSRLNPHHQPL